MRFRPEKVGVPKRWCDAALRWCNKLRKQQGLKPLKRLPAGEPRNAEECPCGVATGMAVYADGAEPRTERAFRVFGEGSSITVPAGVRCFIGEFDKAGRTDQ